MNKQVIFTNEYDEQALKDMQAMHPDISESEAYDMYNDNIDVWIDDVRAQCNIILKGDIVVIANIGTWRGRVCGYKLLKSSNIADCFYSDCDIVTWYIDGRGDMRADAVHHDGTNHYLYREVKASLSDVQLENFHDKLDSGKLTRRDIARYTRSLGKTVEQALFA